MQVFVFKARDTAGRLVVGKVASASMRQVQKDIEKRGLELVSLQPQGKWFDKVLAYSVRVRDRSVFYQQLATMLKAGVSITQAIEISKQTPNKYFSRVLGEIGLGLENGYPLSKCISNYPIVFPAIDSGMIKAGEATGKLEAVCKDLAVQTAKSAAFIAKVRNAMIYPLFIIVVLAIVAVVVMVKIMPTIKQIFEEAAVNLPLSTRILIGVSDFVINKWWVVLIAIIVLAAGFVLFVRTNYGKRFWSSFKINVPIFGQLQREVYLARFNRTFALLLKAGVPIIEAVNIINLMTTNVIYHEIMMRVAKSLEQGAPITSTMQASKYFPVLETQLLYVGQQSGDLTGMCTTLADYYEEEVENKLKSIQSLLEPFILVVVGVGVGFIVISVLAPIYNLASVF